MNDEMIRTIRVVRHERVGQTRTRNSCPHPCEHKITFGTRLRNLRNSVTELRFDGANRMPYDCTALRRLIRYQSSRTRYRYGDEGVTSTCPAWAARPRTVAIWWTFLYSSPRALSTTKISLAVSGSSSPASASTDSISENSGSRRERAIRIGTTSDVHKSQSDDWQTYSTRALTNNCHSPRGKFIR